jgi:hypothetical protein
MGYKYARTWKAIDAAIERSHGLSEYPYISRMIGYVRQYPTDAEALDWNLVCCAGAEILDSPQAPIWNGVIAIWNEERKEVADAKSKSPARLARVT